MQQQKSLAALVTCLSLVLTIEVLLLSSILFISTTAPQVDASSLSSLVTVPLQYQYNSNSKLQYNKDILYAAKFLPNTSSVFVSPVAFSGPREFTLAFWASFLSDQQQEVSVVQLVQGKRVVFRLTLISGGTVRFHLEFNNGDICAVDLHEPYLFTHEYLVHVVVLLRHAMDKSTSLPVIELVVNGLPRQAQFAYCHIASVHTNPPQLFVEREAPIDLYLGKLKQKQGEDTRQLGFHGHMHGFYGFDRALDLREIQRLLLCSMLAKGNEEQLNCNSMMKQAVVLMETNAVEFELKKGQKNVQTSQYIEQISAIQRPATTERLDVSQFLIKGSYPVSCYGQMDVNSFQVLFVVRKDTQIDSLKSSMISVLESITTTPCITFRSRVKMIALEIEPLDPLIRSTLRKWMTNANSKYLTIGSLGIAQVEKTTPFTLRIMEYMAQQGDLSDQDAFAILDPNYIVYDDWALEPLALLHFNKHVSMVTSTLKSHNGQVYSHGLELVQVDGQTLISKHKKQANESRETWDIGKIVHLHSLFLRASTASWFKFISTNWRHAELDLSILAKRMSTTVIHSTHSKAIQIRDHEEQIVYHAMLQSSPWIEILVNNLTQTLPNIRWVVGSCQEVDIPLLFQLKKKRLDVSVHILNNGGCNTLFQSDPYDQYNIFSQTRDSNLPLSLIIPHSRVKHFVSDQNTLARLIGRFTMPPLEKLTPEMVTFCDSLDEIWVPTSFQQSMFVSSGVNSSRVMIVPPSVDIQVFDPRQVPPLAPILLSNERDLTVPEPKKYTFLSIFDITDWASGWRHLIRSFFEEFANTRDMERVKLLLYIPSYGSQADKELREMLFSYAKSTMEKFSELQHFLPQIQIIYNQLHGEQELASLYKSADAFVYPTYGEASGVQILQAMAMELPVIATNWSAPSDFMNPVVAFPVNIYSTFFAKIDGSKLDEELLSDAKTQFCNPSVDGMRQSMRYLVENQAEGKRMGKEARRLVSSRFSTTRVSELVTTLLSSPGKV